MDGDLDAHGYTQEVHRRGRRGRRAGRDRPWIALYLNDTTFRNGGTTDLDLVLFALLRDNQGLNTVGNGIGHDLKATLDGGQSVVLNEFYASDLNTYQSGWWSTCSADWRRGRTPGIEGVGRPQQQRQGDPRLRGGLQPRGLPRRLVNYPNPMDRRGTTFRFDHNQACVALEMSLMYTMRWEMSVGSVNGRRPPRDTEWTDGIGMAPPRGEAPWMQERTSTA